MNGWQTIETAPKDGGSVLVYGEVAGEISGTSGTTCISIAHYSGEGDYGGFDWMCDEGDYYAVWAKPTHWQPLPDPPEAT